MINVDELVCSSYEVDVDDDDEHEFKDELFPELQMFTIGLS